MELMLYLALYIFQNIWGPNELGMVTPTINDPFCCQSTIVMESFFYGQLETKEQSQQLVLKP